RLLGLPCPSTVRTPRRSVPDPDQVAARSSERSCPGETHGSRRRRGAAWPHPPGECSVVIHVATSAPGADALRMAAEGRTLTATLELVGDGRALTGRLQGEDGIERRFSGWME